MTLSSAIENLATIEAELNYLAPTTERPRTYTYDPPPNVPRSTAVNSAHKVLIRDARRIATELTLDQHGFSFVTHRSAVRDFYSDDEVKQVYYQEAENLLKKVTGASRVPHGAACPVRRIGMMAYASRQLAFTSTTPRSPDRNASAIYYQTRRMSCCGAAFR
jgi:hypothetical protein